MKKLAFIFILISQVAIAQLSGFMGKRVVVGYHNLFFPSIIGPVSNSIDGGINTIHCLNIETVIKQRVSFYTSLQYFRTGVLPTQTFQYYYSGYDSNGNSISEMYYVKYHGKDYRPMLLSSFNVALGFRIYASGNLAPLGKYFQPELILMFEKLKYDTDGFDVDLSYNSYNYERIKNFGTGESRYTSFVLAANIGVQRFLFNKIAVDYGIRFGFSPPGWIGFLRTRFFEDSADSLNKNFRIASNERLFRQQLLMLHIGIGIPTF